MVYKNRARTSSLFLMELILAILFFSITSAVCVQFFVKSHILSRDSQALTQAVNECSAVAEICKTSDGSNEATELIQKAYPYATVTDENSDTSSTALSIYYDADFQSCKSDSKNYELNILLYEENTMLFVETKMTDVTKASEEKSTAIYELNTSHHIARRTAYETR